MGTPGDVAGATFDDTEALVAGAGAGQRLGMGPKGFVTIGGNTLLEIAVESLSPLVSSVVVAVPSGCCRRAESLLSRFPNVVVLEGGATRMASYRLAFEQSHARYLVIRDVSRPFASRRLVESTIRAAHDGFAAAACLRPDVPIARADGEVLVEAFDRNGIVIPSNPQCYDRSIMKKVLDHAAQYGSRELTLWEVCLRLGIPVRWIPGERSNIKITSREDLDIARSLSIR